ncbi:amidohydrolase family protein [Brucellaceae bacterium D45D]
MQYYSGAIMTAMPDKMPPSAGQQVSCSSSLVEQGGELCYHAIASLKGQRQTDGPRPRTLLPTGSVDSHVHLYMPGFPAEPNGSNLPLEPLPTPQQYKMVMSRLGLERAIIVQGNAHQFNNDNILACCAELGESVRCIGVVAPQTPKTELFRLKKAGMVGLRLMALSGGAVGLEQIEAMERIARDMDWMLMIQFDGAELESHYDRLLGLRVRWVLDHHGKFLTKKPDGRQIGLIKALLDGGNMWIKFAGCYETSNEGGPHYGDIAQYSRQLAFHNPERIVWGSNWPHNSIKPGENWPDDAEMLDTVLSWFPDDSARKRAMVNNPRELHGLSDTW